MKKTILPLLILAVLAFGCQNSPKKQNTPEPQKEITQEKPQEKPMEKQTAFDPASLPEEPIFVIQTTMGDMTVKLYKDTPLHRDNFVKLASEGYYNDLLFHRVINGFMIQAGDPQSRGAAAGAALGSGGPGYTVPAEILPQFHHKKGALASARTGDSVNPERASSGSQFYIVHNPQTCAQLDGAYTVYGEVIEGLEVIDRIATTPTGPRDRPVKDVKIISILPKK